MRSFFLQAPTSLNHIFDGDKIWSMVEALKIVKCFNLVLKMSMAEIIPLKCSQMRLSNFIKFLFITSWERVQMVGAWKLVNLGQGRPGKTSEKRKLHFHLSFPPVSRLTFLHQPELWRNEYFMLLINSFLKNEFQFYFNGSSFRTISYSVLV